MTLLGKKILATSFIAVLFLSGCATTSSYSPSDHVAFKNNLVMPELKEGMTKDEVIKRFGQPDEVTGHLNFYCYKSYFYNEKEPTRSLGLHLSFDSDDKLKGWQSGCY